jgi:hypothetical protein
LKKTFKIVKDTCERQNCLKISEIAQNLSKLAAENKEFVKFFQIFERFTNLFFTGEIPLNSGKNASQAQRTAIEAVQFVLRTDPRRETSPEGTRRARKRRKTFQPSDLEHRPDSRWISKKLHDG